MMDWLEGRIFDNERIAPLSCELYPFISLHKTYSRLAESTSTPPGTPLRTTTSPTKRRNVADAQDADVV
jgi:hypothetical protein